jgi:hypothetical protein
MIVEVSALDIIPNTWVCNGPRSATVETRMAVKEPLNVQTTVVSRVVQDVGIATPSIVSLVKKVCLLARLPPFLPATLPTCPHPPSLSPGPTNTIWLILMQIQ